MGLFLLYYPSEPSRGDVAVTEKPAQCRLYPMFTVYVLFGRLPASTVCLCSSALQPWLPLQLSQAIPLLPKLNSSSISSMSYVKGINSQDR